MIQQSASRALGDLFSTPIQSVFWKVVGLTILALVALWFAVRELLAAYLWPYLAHWLPDLGSWGEWLGLFGSIGAGIGLAIAVGFLIAPVSAIIAGLFLDDVADRVEQTSYPGERPGQALAFWPALLSSLRFFAVVIAANLLALIFLLVPGVNLVIFFLVNGYLLGREYFEFAAARYLGPERARTWRGRNMGKVMVAGMVIGLFLLVPVLNILTPLFAAIFMVHYVKALMRREAGQPA